MRAVTGVLSVIVMMCLPLAVLGQEDQAEGAGDVVSLENLRQYIETAIVEVRTLDAQLDNVQETDREALLYRRDERGLHLVQDLGRVAREVVSLQEGDPLRLEFTGWLQQEEPVITGMVFRWIAELSQRIAKFSTELESARGSSNIALQTYIYSLENLRLQAYEAIVDILESRDALGLPDSTILPGLQEQLYFYAETLAGRLEYFGAATTGVKERLVNDPQNAELAAAEKSFANEHAQKLQKLDVVSGFLGRLGRDNTAYTELLLQQGQEISVSDLDASMILRNLREGWADLKVTMADRAPDLIVRLLIFILVLLLFRALSRWTRRGVIAACERSRVGMSTLLKSMLASVSAAFVMVLGIVIALSQVGISLGPMLAGLGVAGFIVGFALQDTLGNFAAGGMILIYRPYDVDDVVEVAGASGLVKKMSLVSTTITTFDNQTVVVPNSKIWGDVIKNVTAQSTRRVDLEFGIGYSDDIEKAERVLKDIIDNHDLVLGSPEPTIKLHTLGDSSVNFIVRPWVNTADYWAVYWDVTREVKMRFDRESISIPFPQQDIHLFRESV
jgi:small conductance mechanosensitive channel